MEEDNEQETAGEPGRTGKARLPEENEARVVGRIVNPPKMKEGASAHGDYKMARFTLAVNRSYQDSSRKWVKETDFVPVVLWGALVDRLGKAGKGSALRVEGRIKTWEVEGKNYRWELKARDLQVLDLRPAGAAPAEAKQEEMIPY